MPGGQQNRVSRPRISRVTMRFPEQHTRRLPEKEHLCPEGQHVLPHTRAGGHFPTHLLPMHFCCGVQHSSPHSVNGTELDFCIPLHVSWHRWFLQSTLPSRSRSLQQSNPSPEPHGIFPGPVQLSMQGLSGVGPHTKNLRFGQLQT